MENIITIEQIVRQIVSDMGLSYLCETWPRANAILDKFKRTGEDRAVRAPDGMTLPVCLFVQPVSGRLNLRQGQMQDAPECFLSFADAMPFDFTGEQAQEIAERMKALAVEFICRANESRYFEPIEGDISYKIAFDKLDANLCMVSIMPTLKELHGICIE